MEEKKLTDEAVNATVKSLKWVCNQIPDDLGDSNEERMLKCIRLYCEKGIAVINRQKSEIERLTIAEKQYLSEIERLNKSCGVYHIKLEEQIKETYDYVHKSDKLKKRNAELQKQVDELKANKVIECHGMLKGCDMVKQAVKDTAKEIYEILETWAWKLKNEKGGLGHFRFAIETAMQEIKQKYSLEVRNFKLVELKKGKGNEKV